MRVLLLNYEYPPFGGGAGVATEALARGLARRGMTVEVITAGEQAGEQNELLWDGAAANEGLLTVHRVAVKRVGVHQAGMRAAVGYLRAALPLVRRRLREQQYDVVHFFFSLPTGAMLPFLDLGEVPVVISLRGSDVPGYDPHQRGLARVHRALRPLTRWIWRRADPGGGCVREPRPAGAGDAARPRVLGDPERRGPGPLSSSRRRERRAEPADPLSRGVATGGAEGPGRSDSRLRHAGAGALRAGDRRRRPRRAAAPRSDRRARARRPGPLHRAARSGADGGAAIRDADIFTLASWEEAFGNSFAEALASGLPVVGTDVGGIPELVEHGRNGVLVPPRDPETLAAAIRFLGGRPELRAEMGRRNRAHAEANLSWERMTTRYLATYQGLRRRAPARPVLAQVPSSSW